MDRAKLSNHTLSWDCFQFGPPSLPPFCSLPNVVSLCGSKKCLSKSDSELREDRFRDPLLPIQLLQPRIPTIDQRCPSLLFSLQNSIRRRRRRRCCFPLSKIYQGGESDFWNVLRARFSLPAPVWGLGTEEIRCPRFSNSM